MPAYLSLVPYAAPASTMAWPAGRPRRPPPDVHEARAGHLGAGDAGLLTQPLADPAGQLAGRHADLLGQLEGDRRGVVTVVPVARSLHHDARGNAVGQRSGRPRPPGHRGRARSQRTAARASPLKGIDAPRRPAPRPLVDQLGRLERLGEVGIDPEPRPTGPGRRPAHARRRSPRGSAPSPGLRAAVHRLEAAQPRHHDVQGDHVGTPGLRDLHACFTVRGGTHLEALELTTTSSSRTASESSTTSTREGCAGGLDHVVICPSSSPVRFRRAMSPP